MEACHCEDNRLRFDVVQQFEQNMNSPDILSYIKVTISFCKKTMKSWRFSEFEDAEEFAKSLMTEPAIWLLLKYQAKSA